MDNEIKLAVEKIFIEEKKACDMLTEAEEKGRELIASRMAEREEKINQAKEYILDFKRKEKARIRSKAEEKINEIEENRRKYLGLLKAHYEKDHKKAIKILSQTLLEELLCSKQQ